MTDAGWVNHIPMKYLPSLVAAMGTALLGLVGFMAKKFIETLKSDRKKLDKLSNLDVENLNRALTNHFPHMQDSLQKMEQKQDQTNLELSKQTGVLETIADLLKK